MLKSLSFLGALAIASPAFAGDLGLGRTATPEEVAAWDIDIRPDGAGLPVGSGSVLDGEEAYIDYCAVCHGDFGEAVGRWPIVAGGFDTLDSEDPVKTVGSYWPYLSTVWDYVHRAMPFGNAQSLTDDEVYAITAYILYLNDIVLDEDFVLSNENFTEVRLPNEDGFYMDDRADAELAALSGDVCMKDCKQSADIVMRARVLDVTPGEENQEAAGESAPAAEVAAVTPEAAPAPETEPAPVVVALDPELVKAGEKVFRKCKACHMVGDGAKNRSGPPLNGIVGFPVGAIDGFRYSKAMKEAGENGLVWNEDELTAFLKAPKKYMKKTKMSFVGLKKDKDIVAVIEYLKSHE